MPTFKRQPITRSTPTVTVTTNTNPAESALTPDAQHMQQEARQCLARQPTQQAGARRAKLLDQAPSPKPQEATSTDLESLRCLETAMARKRDELRRKATVAGIFDVESFGWSVFDCSSPSEPSKLGESHGVNDLSAWQMPENGCLPRSVPRLSLSSRQRSKDRSSSAGNEPEVAYPTEGEGREAKKEGINDPSGSQPAHCNDEQTQCTETSQHQSWQQQAESVHALFDLVKQRDDKRAEVEEEVAEAAKIPLSRMDWARSLFHKASSIATEADDRATEYGRFPLVTLPTEDSRQPVDQKHWGCSSL